MCGGAGQVVQPHQSIIKPLRTMDKSNLSNTNGVGYVPPTEVVPKAKLRRFGASFKLRMLNEAEACMQPLVAPPMPAALAAPLSAPVRSEAC